jgi:hypothetical protein
VRGERRVRRRTDVQGPGWLRVGLGMRRAARVRRRDGVVLRLRRGDLLRPRELPRSPVPERGPVRRARRGRRRADRRGRGQPDLHRRLRLPRRLGVRGGRGLRDVLDVRPARSREAALHPGSRPLLQLRRRLLRGERDLPGAPVRAPRILPGRRSRGRGGRADPARSETHTDTRSDTHADTRAHDPSEPSVRSRRRRRGPHPGLARVVHLRLQPRLLERGDLPGHRGLRRAVALRAANA